VGERDTNGILGVVVTAQIRATHTAARVSEIARLPGVAETGDVDEEVGSVPGEGDELIYGRAGCLAAGTPDDLVLAVGVAAWFVERFFQIFRIWSGSEDTDA
jgi:hypothetical protein